MNLPKGDSPALHAASRPTQPKEDQCRTASTADGALAGRPAPTSSRSHAASFRERAVDGIQWAEDWKDGQFAPAYYDKTWPVEMFALVDDYIDLARAYLEATADGG